MSWSQKTWKKAQPPGARAGLPALRVADLTPSQQAQVRLYGPNQRLQAQKLIAGYRSQNRRNKQQQKQQSGQSASKLMVERQSKPGTMPKQRRSGSGIERVMNISGIATVGSTSMLHSGIFDRLEAMYSRMKLKTAMSTTIEVLRERVLLTPGRVPVTQTFSNFPPDFQRATPLGTFVDTVPANGSNHIAAAGVFWPRRGDNSTILFDPGYGSLTVGPKFGCGTHSTTQSIINYPSTLQDPTTRYPEFTGFVANSSPTWTTVPTIATRINANLNQSICLGGALRISVKRGSCTVVIKTLEPDQITTPIPVYSILSNVLSAGKAGMSATYNAKYYPMKPGDTLVFAPSYIDQTNFGFGSAQKFMDGIGTDSTWLPVSFAITECSWSQEAPEIVYESITAIQSSVYMPLPSDALGGVPLPKAVEALSSVNRATHGGSSLEHLATTVDALGRIAAGATAVLDAVNPRQRRRGGGIR